MDLIIWLIIKLLRALSFILTISILTAYIFFILFGTLFFFFLLIKEFPLPTITIIIFFIILTYKDIKKEKQEKIKQAAEKRKKEKQEREQEFTKKIEQELLLQNWLYSGKYCPINHEYENKYIALKSDYYIIIPHSNQINIYHYLKVDICILDDYQTIDNTRELNNVLNINARYKHTEIFSELSQKYEDFFRLLIKDKEVINILLSSIYNIKNKMQLEEEKFLFSLKHKYKNKLYYENNLINILINIGIKLTYIKENNGFFIYKIEKDIDSYQNYLNFIKNKSKTNITNNHTLINEKILSLKNKNSKEQNNIKEFSSIDNTIEKIYLAKNEYTKSERNILEVKNDNSDIDKSWELRQSISGIYKITNIKNGSVYIGESIDISRRWETHFRDLKNNTHHNYKLQNDCNKEGITYFVPEIIKEIKKQSTYFLTKIELLKEEEIQIQVYKKLGYNVYNLDNSIHKFNINEDSRYGNIDDFNKTQKIYKKLKSNPIYYEQIKERVENSLSEIKHTVNKIELKKENFSDLKSKYLLNNKAEQLIQTDLNPLKIEKDLELIPADLLNNNNILEIKKHIKLYFPYIKKMLLEKNSIESIYKETIPLTLHQDFNITQFIETCREIYYLERHGLLKRFFIKFKNSIIKYKKSLFDKF